MTVGRLRRYSTGPQPLGLPTRWRTSSSSPTRRRPDVASGSTVRGGRDGRSASRRARARHTRSCRLPISGPAVQRVPSVFRSRGAVNPALTPSSVEALGTHVRDHARAAGTNADALVAVLSRRATELGVGGGRRSAEDRRGRRGPGWLVCRPRRPASRRSTRSLRWRFLRAIRRLGPASQVLSASERPWRTIAGRCSTGPHGARGPARDAVLRRLADALGRDGSPLHWRTAGQGGLRGGGSGCSPARRRHRRRRRRHHLITPRDAAARHGARGASEARLATRGHDGRPELDGAVSSDDTLLRSHYASLVLDRADADRRSRASFRR